MDNWKLMIGKGMLPGALASVASAAVLAARAKKDSGSVFGGVNAVSHWLWGDKAFRRDGASWKYTLVGYVIHHASGVFWASLLEQAAGKVLARRSPKSTLAASVTAAAVACFVDYQLTPKRLQPGFEERVSRGSLARVYAAFGLGLAAGALLNHRKRSSTPQV
jgi:hypothetical protein